MCEIIGCGLVLRTRSAMRFGRTVVCDTCTNIDLLSYPMRVYKRRMVKAGLLDSCQMIGLLPQRKTE